MSKTYNSIDEAWKEGQKWIKNTNRWEKLEYLEESCKKEFMEKTFLEEAIRWMGEKEFDEFFKHLCRHWEIMTPPELDYNMSN